MKSIPLAAPTEPATACSRRGGISVALSFQSHGPNRGRRVATAHHDDREAIDYEYSDSDAPLRVVIAYGDISAGRRAMNLLTQMLQREPNPVHLFPALWRFDLLEDTHWRERALADAEAADLLILATSKPYSIPASVDRWVSECLSQRCGASTAILASFGAGDEWSISIQESAEYLDNMAPSFPTECVQCNCASRQTGGSTGANSIFR